MIEVLQFGEGPLEPSWPLKSGTLKNKGLRERSLDKGPLEALTI